MMMPESLQRIMYWNFRTDISSHCPWLIFIWHSAERKMLSSFTGRPFSWALKMKKLRIGSGNWSRNYYCPFRRYFSFRLDCFVLFVSATSAPRLLSCRMRLRLAGRNTAQFRSRRPCFNICRLDSARRPGFVPMTQFLKLLPIRWYYACRLDSARRLPWFQQLPASISKTLSGAETSSSRSCV